jgi:predicted acetyltransferase
VQPVVRAPKTDEELLACFGIAARGFNDTVSPEAEQRFLERVHRDRVLAVFVGEEVAAWAQVRPFGQFFGGRSIPMGGFSPVAAAPEHRGHGYGSMVTAAHFPILRERGEVIAGLYPAQTQLYRGVGFEVSGVMTYRRLPARSLHKLRGGTGVPIRRATADDLPAVHDCYRRVAATHPGWLDRPAVWWDRQVPADKVGTEQHVYVVDGAAGEGLAGYIRYRHRSAKPWGYTIVVDELCTEDPEVLLALWRLVGSSSTQAEFVEVAGPPEQHLLLLLPDQDLKTTDEIRWMTRIVDAAGAVAARGFPEAVRSSVDLDLADRHADWNAGRWRLVVEDGAGRLERGGDGEVQLTVNALSALFTGYASATTLRQSGLIASGSARALSALSAAFAGPTPWIVDFY